jgi:hypothetical protein
MNIYQLIISNKLFYVDANASSQPTITYVTPNAGRPHASRRAGAGKEKT